MPRASLNGHCASCQRPATLHARTCSQGRSASHKQQGHSWEVLALIAASPTCLPRPPSAPAHVQLPRSPSPPSALAPSQQPCIAHARSARKQCGNQELCGAEAHAAGCATTSIRRAFCAAPKTTTTSRTRILPLISGECTLVLAAHPPLQNGRHTAATQQVVEHKRALASRSARDGAFACFGFIMREWLGLMYVK